MILRNIYYFFRPRQRMLLRRIIYAPIDLFDQLLGKKEKLVPPRRLIYTGAGSFTAIGNKMVNKIILECHCKPDDFVLDVGSGLGRIAKPLTQFLNDSGAYYGFDIVSDGIKWCKKNYNEFSNFHFDYVPVRNDLYNLSATLNAEKFRFPYGDAYFDVVISISVFTHMQYQGVQNYLFEISRVLKPGKCCFCTFFIITEDRVKNLFFKYEYDNFYLHDKRVKDANVAYKYQVIRQMAENAGLTIAQFIPGWWYDGKKSSRFDFQDVIILKRI
jgi:ubiquinone/menaquinone biosynthesis C-methylase UbiE